MKKMNYLLATAAILAVVGCTKEAEKEIVNPEANKVTLRASVEDSETRVSIGNDYAFAFQSGDKVTVMSADGTPVEFETSDSGTTADFEGTFDDGETVGSYAMYPASDGHEANGNGITFNMKDELTWKADESFMPMLGKVVDGSITFKAVGGVMKLIVYNIPSDAAYLQFTATNKKISGDFEIADATVESPVIVTAAKNASDDTIFIDFSEDYSVNKVFYIPLPTGTIDGFTISFLDGNFNDIEGSSNTAAANLNVTRNKIILAPALNVAPAEEVVLWSEDFTGYAANAVPVEGTGYGNAVVSYSVEDGTDNGATKIYNDQLAGGTAPEILVAKSDGSFTAEGIPTAGATSAILTYTTNNNNNAVSTSTEGVTIGARSKNGTVVTYPITISSSVSSFDLCITNSSSSNTRIDNIVLKGTVGTAPTIPTIFVGKESETISAGALEASISGVKLENALDDLGIIATTDAEWLSVAFTSGSFETGAKLTATANSYNHESEARSATVTLKATGASKTVTFKQNPSVVNNPSSLAATPGDQTFSVAWTGDAKAASYVAYYSTTELSDPTTGTALTISNNGNAYTAVPAQTLVNRTTYYVYVKVATLTAEYADKYGISEVWATTTVVPVGEVPVQTVDAPYSQMFKADGKGQFVIDVHDDGGSESDIWTYDSAYGMVASGQIGSTKYNTEAWLLSPKITIASTITNPYVSFKHAGNYFTNAANVKTDVPIYIREEGGSWVQMNVNYPAGNNWTFVEVDYALSSYIGKTVQFAWAYHSSSTRCGKYELDEFKVYDKQASGGGVSAGTVLFSDTFDEAIDGTSAQVYYSSSETTEAYSSSSYGTLTYTRSNNSNVSIENNNTAGGDAKQVMINKNGGSLTISGIKSYGATKVQVTFKYICSKTTAPITSSCGSTSSGDFSSTTASTASYVAVVSGDTFDLMIQKTSTASSTAARFDDITITVVE